MRTRKAIREAFLRLTEEEDYRKITVTAIAHEADIDRKTFYLHYRTVDELAEEIIRVEAEQIVEAWHEEVLQGSGTTDIGELFERILARLSLDVSRARRVAKHLSTEEVLAKMEGSLTEALIEEDLLGLKKMGPYLGYYVTFFIGGLISVYRRWLLSESDVPLEDLSKMVDQAVLGGVEGVLKEPSAV